MFFWLLVFLIIFLDWGSKYWVMKELSLGQTIPVIKSFFHITYLQNSGAAFGLLPGQKWFFICTAFLALAVIIYLQFTLGVKQRFLSLTLALLTGGISGNLIDRFYRGVVIDFLDFRGLWPYVFNLADVAIVCGMLFLVWQILFLEKE